MIQLTNIKKKYKKKSVLSIMDLTINNGEVIGIFGENGVGKTTLLKAIMNLINIESYGEILVDGKPVSNDTYKDLIYISEEGTLFNDMTAREHEEFFMNYYKTFDHKRFNRLLALFDVNPDDKVRIMSKGQRAKLEVILGMCKGGKYILMDEPFLGNDAFTRNDFLRILAGLMPEDGIIVIATHLMNEVENFIDRAVILGKEGKMVADITTDELRKQGKTVLDYAREIYGIPADRVMAALEVNDK